MQHRDKSSSSQRAIISAMGRTLSPETLSAVQDLYRPAQERLAAHEPAAAVDLAYGDDPRQCLDLYSPVQTLKAAPILLFVHGGGFVRGDKRSPGNPYNAHVGRWAARNGMLGAVMNYRLAPAHGWPAGGEDVGLAVDWLRNHASGLGGDPQRILLVGTSAGSAHIATFLRLRPDVPDVRGAILLSGLYGFSPLDERDTLYFGAADRYRERWSRDAVIETSLPLMLATAEFDPSRFQTETVELLSARLARHGFLPRTFYASGHNHYSLACHLGTEDTRLSNEMLSFVESVL